MALKPCKECGREISTEATVCPHCGKKFPTGQGTSRVAMGCLVLVVLVFIKVLLPSGSSKNSSDENASASSSAAVPTPTPASPSTPGSQWNYVREEDPMTGKVERTASVQSINTVEFAFPYNGTQRGSLYIRRHPRFGNSVIFRIEKGQLLCPSYEGCTVLVRFDDGEPQSFSAAPPSDHSTETIFIKNYDRFIEKLRTARRVRVSPKVYQEGSVVFSFDVAGFDATKLRAQGN
jgi:hypothetical protein